MLKEELHELFEKAKTFLTGEKNPLDTLNIMHELMHGFFHYMEKKLDGMDASA